MKQIWAGRVGEVAGKYAENAPTAAVCCNACRTCITTNLIGLTAAAIGAAGLTVTRVGKRLAGRP